MKIIHRYILKETLWPFLFGFLFFNFILFVGIVFDLTRLIFMENVPLFMVLQLIIFSLPSFFDIIVPIALLFSVLLSFGRLSADGEITALRSSGISLLRVESSILLFALGLTFISLFFSASLTPWSNQRYKSVYQEILLRRPEVQLKERTIINIDDKRIYAFELDEKNRIMREIMLCEFFPSSPQKFPQITLAREGKIEQEKILLQKVELYIFGANYRLHQYGEFDRQAIYLHPEIRTPKKLEKESWDMTLTEIREKLREEKLTLEQKRRFEIDFQGRIAIPLATFILGILAIPLGVKVERGDKSISLGISLVVVIAYYVTFLAGNFFARAGLVSPFLGAWIPNFILLSTGVWLNMQMIRK
ncbi:LptF/LptG family permease [Candidatus Aerophobetes bacterium]|nr:LptF/LptG family permease [Candidatus Aerophobetes bacterium]